MDTALMVGYLASVCSVCSFVPQVWKVVRTGDTEAISARMYCLTVTGFVLWTAFGVMRAEWPINHPHECCLLSTVGVYPSKEAQKFARATNSLVSQSGTTAPGCVFSGEQRKTGCYDAELGRANEYVKNTRTITVKGGPASGGDRYADTRRHEPDALSAA
ncbi:PQ-loop domain-containing transporter [Rhizobium redzepovicii]|uniref:PQ-loop domain-containing transporter n=1 Tax=Rhizobium redzepovicii TaxID=2867518 RepID=A0AAW8P763_9HYPH|nr:PQ-loop domain-containing transporter [Rhizobium redzepovicii]MDR9762862.1 PQ-loop domain-containing transporter [Rhizobium redzepovicii]